MEKMTREEMINELEQYFEAAGFDSVYERELKDKTNKEIEDLIFSFYQSKISISLNRYLEVDKVEQLDFD